MYYINLLLIVILGILLCEIKPCKQKTILYLGICMLMMASLFTLRYGMGYDFYSYKRIFASIASATNFSSLMATSHMKDYPLFTLLNYAVASFSNNYMILNLLFACIIFSCLGFSLYFYSPIPWISVFCYVTLLHFYLSMNFVRQAIAICIVLMAYTYLKQRRIVPYALIILVAASVHLYALIMLPAYFFLVKKLSKKYYIVISGISLALFIFSQEILDILSELSPRINNYVNSIYIQTGNQFRFVIFWIICFVTILSFSKLLIDKAESNSIFINLAFYGMIFNLFSLRHSILERFAHYFTIFIILAFAEIADGLRPQKESWQNGNSKVYKKQLKLQWFNYRWYICSLLLILLLNHAHAAINNAHRVFPYRWVFDKKWVQQIDYVYYEMDGAVGWPLRDIYASDFPEELR